MKNLDAINLLLMEEYGKQVSSTIVSMHRQMAEWTALLEESFNTPDKDSWAVDLKFEPVMMQEWHPLFPPVVPRFRITVSPKEDSPEYRQVMEAGRNDLEQRLRKYLTNSGVPESMVEIFIV